MRAVLSATPDAGSPPTPAVAAMSWQNQFGQPSHLDETAWTPAWHYSMVATMRCEIQAIDRHWSCHRLAIALTTGDRDEGLNKIEQRQQRYLGRELARLDEYFTQYKVKLTGRLARHQKTESKSRYEDRLKAAHAEHARRRADQIHRHAIRVIPTPGHHPDGVGTRLANARPLAPRPNRQPGHLRPARALLGAAANIGPTHEQSPFHPN
jgi:hypothetical protein